MAPLTIRLLARTALIAGGIDRGSAREDDLRLSTKRHVKNLCLPKNIRGLIPTPSADLIGRWFGCIHVWRQDTLSQVIDALKVAPLCDQQFAHVKEYL